MYHESSNILPMLQYVEQLSMLKITSSELSQRVIYIADIIITYCTPSYFNRKIELTVNT